jgi:hypothetical protein
MEQQLQAIATVLSLVNPTICGALFARIEAGRARAARLADATRAALAVLVILVVAALVGAKVLQVFSVSLLFRHWLLGFGSGDLLVKTAGANAQQFEMHNVLFVGSKLQLIQEMLQTREVLGGG